MAGRLRQVGSGAARREAKMMREIPERGDAVRLKLDVDAAESKESGARGAATRSTRTAWYASLPVHWPTSPYSIARGRSSLGPPPIARPAKVHPRCKAR